MKSNFKKKLLWNSIIILAISLFLGTGASLSRVFIQYDREDKEYRKIADIAKGKEVTIDFNSLRAINEDIVGWITIPNTVIDYPIVQGKDNQEYLETSFGKEKSKGGAIFLDANNQKGFQDEISIVYGHNRKDGSMFHLLNSYVEQEFYERNPIVFIATPEWEKEFKIISVSITEEFSDIYQYGFSNSKHYARYLENQKERSLYDTKVSYDRMKPVIILSTCRNEKRMVLLLQDI